MGYILIVIGIICIIGGIIVLQKPSTNNTSINEEQREIKKLDNDEQFSKGEPTEAEKKGLDFEKYVVNKFPKKYYSIKEWRSDKRVNGHYAETNTYPDLELILHLGKSEFTFAVECKWRHDISGNGYIKWCEESQLERYNIFAKDKNIPVFIVLGIGGTPSTPSSVYCVPLRSMKFNKVKKEYLEDFKHDDSKEFYYYAKEEELR